MDNEKELVRLAQRGDAAAFEQLIAEHQRSVFSIAYRFSGNPDDAADMAQEVLIKVFRNLGQFKGGSKFSTWLYRVAVNTCLDKAKSIRRHAALSLDQELEVQDGSVKAEPADPSPTPEQAAERSAVRDAVNTAIARLGPEHKQVIILRDIQGFSYEETARILDCSVGTVKSRISRARQQLKKILSEDRELFSDYFVQ